MIMISIVPVVDCIDHVDEDYIFSHVNQSVMILHFFYHV